MNALPRIDNRPADERLDELMQVVEHLRDLKRGSNVLRFFSNAERGATRPESRAID